MASWIVPVGLAAAETYGIYAIVEPAHLKPSERIPAYFGDVEWWCPIAATVAYLGFCYFGSKVMRKRGKPLDEAFMKRCMMVYNFYQTVFNVLCIVLVLKAHREQGMKVWGNVADWGVGGFGVARFIWMHYNNKYIELLDSVFMVLRCKFEHLSFLHVYHHTLLIWSWCAPLQHCLTTTPSGWDATWHSHCCCTRLLRTTRHRSVLRHFSQPFLLLTPKIPSHEREILRWRNTQQARVRMGPCA